MTQPPAEIADNVEPVLPMSEARPIDDTSERMCRSLFYVLVAQTIFICVWSLVAQTGPIFVYQGFFGLDFADFYRASLDWLHGVNPYLRPRFFTPPPSLMVGTAFSWIPFAGAKFVYFALNLGIIVASVRACARKLRLSRQCVSYLTGITLLFYPVYFQVERGNLEGLVLGCLCWAFCTDNATRRGALVGLAGGLKLYPLLLIAPAILKRQWRFVLGALIAFSALMLLFHPLLHSFLHSVARRGSIYEEWENISPAGVILGALGPNVGRLVYMIFWTGTLVLTLQHMGRRKGDITILPFLPWMVAFPAQVFPYGGVLLLPTLAWKLREIKGSGITLTDKIFLCGFLLLGVQAWALTGYFSSLATPHPVFHLANSLGMVLILGSLAMSANLATHKRPAPAYA